MTQNVRLVVSRGRPRTRPIATCGLEAGLAPSLEVHDLGGAPHGLRPRGDPHEMKVHLMLLSVCGRHALSG